jgi:uncharacterized protein (TIGR03437 family)
MNEGIVTVGFSNGDPTLRLRSTQNGRWSVTWPPANVRTGGIQVTLTALQQETNLRGSVQIGGGVTPNPVPVIAEGGVLDTASYRGTPAPGSLVAIFGTRLASGPAQAGSLPLPSSLADTSVLLGGELLPLSFASDGQVNAQIPYTLAPNARHQIVVMRGDSLSVPQNVTIGAARPAVFTVDGSGGGQGHIYRAGPSGTAVLAGPDSPARSGEVVVVYCAGLGAVSPEVPAGTAAPLTSLSRTIEPTTALIQGLPATVSFAGLTPGFVGLYQVNVQIPESVVDSDTTALVLTVGDQSSVPVLLAVRR